MFLDESEFPSSIDLVAGYSFNSIKVIPFSYEARPSESF